MKKYLTHYLIIIFACIMVPTLYAKSSQQPVLTQEQKIESATNIVITYFELLTSKNIIDVSHLHKLQEANELINPISKTERDSSSVTFTFASQLDNLIAKGKTLVDFARIKDWSAAKIAELKRAENTRKQVHEDTRELHRPMRFFEIPAGEYVDEITDEEFEIKPGIEIQDTPVTQWQWMLITQGTIAPINPSHFVESPDSEEFVIDGKKIKIQPDTSVNNVSWNDVQTFIKMLNWQDTDYYYDLPSAQDYQAVMQNMFGQNWIANIEKTSPYVELSGNRVWDIMGNVWQWTRGTIHSKDTDAHLVFGASYTTDTIKIKSLKDILRPIVYDDSKGKYLGLRLIRYKKSSMPEIVSHMYFNNPLSLSWNQSDCDDQNWQWNEFSEATLIFNDDGLRWLFEHKEWIFEHKNDLSSMEILVTLGELIRFVDPKFTSDDPVKLLKSVRDLDLKECGISDLRPLSYLTNLIELTLSYNLIKDISPLAHLTKLENLYLNNNFIKNITAIGQLKNLQTVNLSDNLLINDLTPLFQIKNLRLLHLGGFKKRDQSEGWNIRKRLPNVGIVMW